MRFLMKTLLALNSTAVASCVPTKLYLDALALCRCFCILCEAWLLPSGHNYSSRSFGISSILLFKAAATAIYASEIPPCRGLHPIPQGTFPIR
jgi:hypothetical protein